MTIALYLLGMIYAWAFNSGKSIKGVALILNILLWPIIAVIGLVVGVYKGVTSNEHRTVGQ